MQMTAENAKEKKKSKSSSSLFWASACFTAIFSIWGVVNPESLTNTLYSWTSRFNNDFNWFVILMPIINTRIMCILSIW